MQKILSMMVLVFVGYLLNAQSLEVNGSVKDSKGEPLRGVIILIKGTPDGTVSNPEGHFKVAVPHGTHVLVYSLNGYKSLEQKIHVTADFPWDLEVVMVADGAKKKGSTKFVDRTTVGQNKIEL